MDKHFRILLFLTLASIYFTLSCSGEKKGGPVLDVRIIGLDKGTVYLKGFQNDTALRILDSARIKGQKHIRFDLSQVPPQLLFLEVKERPGEYLMFFSDDTTTRVVTQLDKFGYAKRIQGGKNVRLWQQYKEMLYQYNSHKLDLTQANFTAYKNHDSTAMDSLNRKALSLERRRKLFAYNFAMSKPYAPVRAYVAYVEFRDNPAALDTIYRHWPAEMQQTFYGKQIRQLIDSTTRK